MKLQVWIKTAIGLLVLLPSLALALGEGGHRIMIPSTDGQPAISARLFNAYKIDSESGQKVSVLPKAALLVVHGIQSNSAWFTMGEDLAAQGITVLAYDRRGSGWSEGAWGHITSKEDFFVDFATAATVLGKVIPKNTPLHVMANCFGTRIVLPFIGRYPKGFASIILTSPATHMTKEASFSMREKLSIYRDAVKLAMAGSDKAEDIGSQMYDLPLTDTMFTTGEMLGWIGSEHSRSLRKVSLNFLAVAGGLTKEMSCHYRDESKDYKGPVTKPRLKHLKKPKWCKKVNRLTTPLYVALASKDVIVNNKKIKKKFFDHYDGQDKQLRTFDSEHFIEFGPARQQFIDSLVDWIGQH